MWNDTHFSCIGDRQDLGLGHGFRHWVRSSPFLFHGTFDWSVGRALSSAKLDGVKGEEKSSMALLMKDRPEILFGVPPDLSLVRQRQLRSTSYIGLSIRFNSILTFHFSD